MSVRLPNKAHASVFPDVAIPPADLVSFILHNPAAPFAMTPARLKHTAFIDAESGTRLTYAGLIESSIGVARCLFDAGLKRGDVAFVISPNSMHMPTVTFACLRAGMTVSPCNPAYTLREITSQIKDCGAKAIFASESCLSTVVEAAAACGIPKERIILMPTSKDLVAAPTISKEILGLGSFPTLLGLIEKGKTSKAKVQEGWVDRKEGESSGMVAYLVGFLANEGTRPQMTVPCASGVTVLGFGVSIMT